MLWVYLSRLLINVICFLAPPSIASQLKPRVINPDERCPSCGAEHGALTTVRPNGERTVEGVPTRACLVRHWCAVCKARWYEKPLLLDKNADLIYPAEMIELPELKETETRLQVVK